MVSISKFNSNITLVIIIVGIRIIIIDLIEALWSPMEPYEALWSLMEPDGALRVLSSP